MMRRKYNIPVILTVLALVIGLGSCDKEQEVEAVISPDDYPTATFTTDFSGTEIEEGDTILYTITIDKMNVNPITFSAAVIGGTGSDDDFDVTDGTIAAYTTETTVQIIALRDYVADNDCTVELEIGALGTESRYELNSNTVNPVLSLAIENYISESLEITFSWDLDIAIDASNIYDPEYETGDYSTHDHIDFNFYLADLDGYDPADPETTFNSGFEAVTGVAPEVAEFINIGDGKYVIYSQLSYNDFSDIDTVYNVVVTDSTTGNYSADTAYYSVSHDAVPITVNVTKQGVFSDYEFEQDASQVLSSEVIGKNNDTYAGELINTYVCSIEIVGDEYTIREYDETLVVKGKIEELSIAGKKSISLRK